MWKKQRFLELEWKEPKRSKSNHANRRLPMEDLFSPIVLSDEEEKLDDQSQSSDGRFGGVLELTTSPRLPQQATLDLSVLPEAPKEEED